MDQIKFRSQNLGYYTAKTKYGIEEAYNRCAYPSYQERIDTAKKYLA